MNFNFIVELRVLCYFVLWCMFWKMIMMSELEVILVYFRILGLYYFKVDN